MFVSAFQNLLMSEHLKHVCAQIQATSIQATSPALTSQDSAIKDNTKDSLLHNAPQSIEGGGVSSQSVSSQSFSRRIPQKEASAQFG